MGTGSWWSVDSGVAYLSKASPAQNFLEHRGEAIIPGIVRRRDRGSRRSLRCITIALNSKRVDGDDFPAHWREWYPWMKYI